MPFGKFGKGKGNLTISQVKHEQPDYVAWLMDQEGFDKKNPELYEYFKTGVTHAKPMEKENYDAEAELLAGQSDAFKKFWFRSYGERLRKDGAFVYIGYLRVAIATWDAAQPQQELFKKLPPKLASVPEGDKEGTPIDEDTPF